jgi:hypothetical protein
VHGFEGEEHFDDVLMTLARGCDVQDVKKNGEESKMQKIFGGGNTESTLYSGKAVAALAMDKKNLMRCGPSLIV